MDKKQRLEKLTNELIDVIEKHMNEWEDEDSGASCDDIDKILAQAEAAADKPAEPVTYAKHKKIRR